MFELPEERKEAGRRRLWIGASVVVVLLVLGALVYLVRQPGAQAPPPVPSAAATPAASGADPIRDLRVIRASLGKDRTGTMAIWSVLVRNRSDVYTYSDIQYETSYISADDRPLLINKGTLKGSIEPGGEKHVSELVDALYPTGTVWHKFRVTGATATQAR